MALPKRKNSIHVQLPDARARAILYGMPDYNSVEIIKEKFGITTNIKGCEPPLANQKNYLYSCNICNYETGNIKMNYKPER